jgi:hypothetical protein
MPDMMRRAIGRAIAGSVLLAGLSACSEETTPADTAPVEQGGEAAGEIEGGAISDAMIPLEALRSQSPTIDPPATTTTSTTSEADGGTQTRVETTAVTTRGAGAGAGAGAAPAPSPPEPPATPGGRR